MEKKVLGKGLAALIPQRTEVPIAPIHSNENFQSGNYADKVSTLNSEDANQAASNKNIAYVKTDLIQDNSLQPRENYDPAKLAELMDSIKEKGVLQPILVRRHGQGYEVVAGERRLRAARALKLTQIPVIIKDVTDRESLVLALVENMQREGLNPVEEAKGFKRLIDEFGFTAETVAQSVGKDRSTVTNLVRLLRLPAAVHALIVQDKISAGHARALLAVDNAAWQIKMANEIFDKQLSVRHIEGIVKKSQQPAVEQVVKKTLKSRDVEILEEELRRKLGTKVSIDDKKGKGKVTIEYYTLDDLDRILGVLRK